MARVKSAEKSDAIIGLRVPASLKARLVAAAGVGPYKLTMTQVAERGLLLAIEELEGLKQ